MYCNHVVLCDLRGAVLLQALTRTWCCMTSPVMTAYVVLYDCAGIDTTMWCCVTVQALTACTATTWCCMTSPVTPASTCGVWGARLAVQAAKVSSQHSCLAARWGLKLVITRNADFTHSVTLRKCTILAHA